MSTETGDPCVLLLFYASFSRRCRSYLIVINNTSLSSIDVYERIYITCCVGCQFVHQRECVCGGDGGDLTAASLL